MPKFDLSVPHTLGKEAALERLQGFAEKLKEKQGERLSELEHEWEGDRLSFSFKAMGIGISGGLTVEESAVRVEGDLPFTAAMFKGQITGAIQEQLDKLLA